MSRSPWGLICCICFTGLTAETCGVDKDGRKWDVCPGQCMKAAGMEELSADATEGTE